MAVRPYRESDRDAVHFVHLNSEGPCKSTKRGINFGFAVYCDYYIDKEPKNCFVATDENDKAIGYIICAEDFDRFYGCFLNEYYTRIKKWEYKRRKSALRSIESQKKYKSEYPAHLHIDILPEYQRMGLGKELMDTLCNHLRQKNIKGIVLTVWYKNEKACRFYEKYGFRLIETKETTLVYAIDL